MTPTISIVQPTLAFVGFRETESYLEVFGVYPPDIYVARHRLSSNKLEVAFWRLGPGGVLPRDDDSADICYTFCFREEVEELSQEINTDDGKISGVIFKGNPVRKRFIRHKLKVVGAYPSEIYIARYRLLGEKIDIAFWKLGATGTLPHDDGPADVRYTFCFSEAIERLDQEVEIANGKISGIIVKGSTNVALEFFSFLKNRASGPRVCHRKWEDFKNHS